MNKCKCGNLCESKKKTCSNCKNGRHGVKFDEMKRIAELQWMKCPILGTPFALDETHEESRILDLNKGKRWKTGNKKLQRVCIDHDHITGDIRGLLSNMGNMLVGGFDRGEYGTLSMPKEMNEYLKSNFAYQIVGKRKFI